MALRRLVSNGCTTHADSLEHLFPSAIGGRWQILDILCKRCNSNCGAGIDARLCEALGPARMLLSIVGDRGQTATVRGTAPNIGAVDLEAGAVPGAPDVQTAGTHHKVRVATLRQAVDFVRARLRKKQYIQLHGAEILSVFPEHVKMSFSVGGEPFFQSAAKTALVAMCAKGVAAGSAETDLWGYVRGGKLVAPAVVANMTQASRPWPLPKHLDSLSHQVTVECDVHGRLRADVRYFGGLAAAFEAQGTPPRSPWRIGMALDPFTGARSEMPGSGAALAPVSPLASAVDHALTQQAVHRAVTEILWRWRLQSVKSVVGDLWRGVSRGPLRGRALAARRFVHIVRRREWSRDAPDVVSRLRDEGASQP